MLTLHQLFIKTGLVLLIIGTLLETLLQMGRTIGWLRTIRHSRSGDASRRGH